jgi:formate dehydrogenase iron-sulfur subunit
MTFARVGITDPVNLDDYLAHGGYRGLRKALSLAPAAIVTEVTESGLRGRGGAAFPTGIKWKTVLDQPPGQKYVTCNADEGDSGTFSDRMLMEGDPFMLIEGMTIAAMAVGATQGYIYLRIEYPHARAALTRAIATARAAGYLGNVLGSGRYFDLEVRMGAGAYICGEETSMLESLEGKRGEVRVRPPLPAVAGLFGRPQCVRPPDPCGAGWRPAWRLRAGGRLRRGARLRSLRRHRCPARAWWGSGVRRHGEHGRDGEVCDGVLRARVVRQVHALPHRLDSRR